MPLTLYPGLCVCMCVCNHDVISRAVLMPLTILPGLCGVCTSLHCVCMCVLCVCTCMSVHCACMFVPLTLLPGFVCVCQCIVCVSVTLTLLLGFSVCVCVFAPDTTFRDVLQCHFPDAASRAIQTSWPWCYMHMDICMLVWMYGCSDSVTSYRSSSG